MNFSKKEINNRLNCVYESQKYIIAISTGSGISAKYAAAGGADLILVLNAGRYRQMGLSSLSGMMPFANSNGLVMDFGSREIVPLNLKIPIIFGLCATDPTIETEQFINKIIENGFYGINNFPTVGLIDGVYREYLEETGFSYQKEIDAIRLANQKDLFTLAFVFSEEQAVQMAEAGADAICAHLGFTRGGIMGVKHYLSLNEAASFAKRIFDVIDQLGFQVIKLVYGGPIQTPADAEYVLLNSGSMGFIGGSSFERIPNEKLISEITTQFKKMGTKHDAVANLLDSINQDYDYIGFIREYISEHYMEKILLQDMANLLHMSRSYLSYLFNKELGCSFPEYLMEVRMNKAKEILNKKNISIQMVAEMVGFNDQSYFTKKFKAHFGIYPRNFIKK